MSKVILLNGPPSSGKDTLGAQLMLLPNVKMRSFKKALVYMTRVIYKIPLATWTEWYTTEGKEIPREELMGMSQREALIHVSEHVGKPFFGLDVWGKAVASTMPVDEESIYVLTDSGFKEEAQVLIDKFGAENVHVVRIKREGYTFEGDSRDYLEPSMFDSRVRFTDTSLSPTFEGESHYSRTKKVAESLYNDVKRSCIFNSKLLDAFPIKHSNK